MFNANDRDFNPNFDTAYIEKCPYCNQIWHYLNYTKCLNINDSNWIVVSASFWLLHVNYHGSLAVRSILNNFVMRTPTHPPPSTSYQRFTPSLTPTINGRNGTRQTPRGCYLRLLTSNLWKSKLSEPLGDCILNSLSLWSSWSMKSKQKISTLNIKRKKNQCIFPHPLTAMYDEWL